MHIPESRIDKGEHQKGVPSVVTGSVIAIVAVGVTTLLGFLVFLISYCLRRKHAHARYANSSRSLTVEVDNEIIVGGISDGSDLTVFIDNKQEASDFQQASVVEMIPSSVLGEAAALGNRQT